MKLEQKEGAMQTYRFTLILDTRDGSDFDLEAAADALFEAGCDDGLPGILCGVPQIGFDREADSLEEAIASAIADVAKSAVPLKVIRIEPDR